MSESDESARAEQALENELRRDDHGQSSEAVYFLPERSLSEAEVRTVLNRGSVEEQAEIVTGLLCFGQWDDIWSYVDHEQVVRLFPHLDLPERLRAAWARQLEGGDSESPDSPPGSKSD